MAPWLFSSALPHISNHAGQFSRKPCAWPFVVASIGAAGNLSHVLLPTPGSIPLAMVLGRALFSPRSMEEFAASAVKAYSVTPEAIDRVVEAASEETNPTRKS